jgi:hypothetical protein
MPADGMIELFNPPRPARANMKLNIRSGVTLSAPRVGHLKPDDTVNVEASVQGESFHGQGIWYQLLGGGRFVWGGGVTLGSTQPSAPVSPALAAAGPVVHTHIDGTVTALTVPQIGKVFGTFMSKPARKPGFIDIERAWVEANITSLEVPALAPLAFPEIAVHRFAAPHFRAVFAEIERQGLNDDLLICGGTFVPRYVSMNVNNPLSSHSWGIAIDLNVAWNGYGRRPALIDQHGTVRRIVPIFNAGGFAWGGHFTTESDGMHFELARLDV